MREEAGTQSPIKNRTIMTFLHTGLCSILLLNRVLNPQNVSYRKDNKTKAVPMSRPCHT